MKRYLVLLFIILIMCGKTSYAQRDYSVNLNVLNLPEIDLAGLIISENLQGTPNFFSLVISGLDSPYRVYCGITWRGFSQNANEDTLISFCTTKDLNLPVIQNTDFGTGIFNVRTLKQNRDLINKVLEKGKPVGDFKIIISIYPRNPLYRVKTVVEPRTFRSYSQSISILFPVQGLTLDPGSIVVSWIGIEGIAGNDSSSYYFIRVAERRNSSQPLEDALTPGNLIIEDQKIQGNVTAVNLRSLRFSREWNPAKEIVLQVCAHLPGFGGGTNLKSQPVSFHLMNANSTTSNSQTIIISNAIQSFFQTLPPSVVALLTSGQMTIQEFLTESGSRITAAEVQAALAYIQANPSSVLSVKFVPTTRSQD